MNWNGAGDGYWDSLQSQENFQSLISTIIEKNCTVFVGSGISINANYPSTYKLIDILCESLSIQSEEIPPKADGSERSFEETFQWLHDQMEAEDFYNLIFDRFDPRVTPGIDPPGQTYLNLLSLPFKSFVTTNFDPCIRYAADVKNVTFDDHQIYPELDPSNVDRCVLYQIHGAIDPEQRENSMGRLCLTSNQFSQAYDESTSRLPTLMQNLLGAHDLLIVGYSLQEQSMRKLIEIVKKQQDLNLLPKPLKRYALLPALDIVETKESLIMNGYDEEEAEKVAQELTNDERDFDQELNHSYGILPLRYKSKNNHYAVREIIEELDKEILKREKVATELKGKAIFT